MKTIAEQAHDLALYLDVKNNKTQTPEMVRYNTNIFNDLMWLYQYDEIKKVIDYLVDVKKKRFYSAKYFKDDMKEYLEECVRLENSKLIQQQIEEEMLEYSKVKRQEEVDYGESTKRNRDKARRFSLQSGKRTKYLVDLFEGQQQDS